MPHCFGITQDCLHFDFMTIHVGLMYVQLSRQQRLSQLVWLKNNAHENRQQESASGWQPHHKQSHLLFLIHKRGLNISICCAVEI